jgi:archaeosine-15-forming tRNA-guanine transglycosylase
MRKLILQRRQLITPANAAAKRKFADSKLKMSFDYVFGRGASRRIDFEKIDFVYSRKTGRIRHIVDSSGIVLFTFRPDGSIAPTILGARTMLGSKPMKGSLNQEKNLGRPRWTLTVLDGVGEFVGEGKTVFCRHVAACDKSLLAGEDVIVLNEAGILLGVGRTAVPGQAMKQFKRGVAVKMREGVKSRHGTVPIV